MSFFGNLFRSVRSESLVFVDISAGSVAGAYVHYKHGVLPSVVFTRRVPIELRVGEPQEQAMLRSLDVLGAALIRDGAPALARRTGSGSASTILVSVDAPWQETKVRTERFERRTPFLFTKNMVETAFQKTSIAAPGKLLADESIIGTILNGYETRAPYGRRVHRASVIVLASFIDEKVSQAIVTMLRELFHTKNILSIAGNSLRYQAMRTVFPHERDLLILDGMGPLISTALVRKGLLVAVNERSGDLSVRDPRSWVEKVREELTEIAKRYPLPRTIFLLAQDQEIGVLEKALNAAELKELWLSDNPPKIISVLASHVSSFVEQTASSLPDLSLLLMAVYWGHRSLE